MSGLISALTFLAVAQAPSVSKEDWALHVLSGHSGQILLQEYYKKTGIDTTYPVPKGDPPLQFDKDIDKAWKKTDKQTKAAFKENDHVGVLDKLGDFIVRYPEESKRVWSSYEAQLKLIAEKLQSGCSRCMAMGQARCQGCEGRGQTSTSGPCQACDPIGSGKKPCSVCGGDRLMTCKKCKGSGQVQVQEYPKQRMGTCPTCDGACQIMCDNRPCQDGRLTCQVCKGTGQQEQKTRCPQCAGGRIPCPACHAKETRDNMDETVRQADEEAVRARIAQSQ